MSRTHRGTPAARATALFIVMVLGGSALAGCSAEGDPEAGAATPAASPSTSPSEEVVSPEASGTPSAPGDEQDEPSPGPSGDDRSGAGDDEPSGDDPAGEDADGDTDGEGEVAGASESAPGRDDDEPGDEGRDEGREDGDDASGKDEEEAGEPELPEFVAYGETSERVEAVQERLQELGYLITAVDGTYGGETQQALWALQKAAGLYRDGVVGPSTRKALDDGVVARSRSTSGKVIEIDIDRQLLLAVEDGVVVKTLNAASGNGERFTAKGATYYASTPRGDFSVYNEIDGMHQSTLELGDMYRPKYFNGGIAVHGSTSIPPFPASHGCVRVSNTGINWIWDTWGAPKGTRVLVY